MATIINVIIIPVNTMLRSANAVAIEIIFDIEMVNIDTCIFQAVILLVSLSPTINKLIIDIRIDMFNILSKCVLIKY